MSQTTNMAAPALSLSLWLCTAAVAGAQAKTPKDTAKRAAQPPPPTVVRQPSQPPPPTVVRTPPPPPKQPRPPTVVRASKQPPPPTVIRSPKQPLPPTVVQPAKQPPPPTVVRQDEAPPPSPTVTDEQPPPPTVVREGAQPAEHAAALRIRSVKYDPRGGVLVLSLLVDEYLVKTAGPDLYLTLHMRVRDPGGKIGIIAPNCLPLGDLRHFNAGEPGLVGVVVALPWDSKDPKGQLLTGSAQSGFKAELVRLTGGQRALLGATAGRVPVLLPAP